MDSRLVLAVSLGYVAALFAIAWRGDSASPVRALKGQRQPLLYALSLAVYCTSWTFYGAVGRAATAGFDFLSIYAGPILVLMLGWPVLAKMVRVAKAENVVSISDFISARYGKSRGLAALVTGLAVIGVLPYFALQIKAITISLEALTGGALTPGDPERPGYTTLAVTAAMAAFAILFGVRNIHANEHHRGLMRAIATESLVKLGAALLVGGGIAIFLSNGPGRLADAVAADPALRELLRPDLDAGWWAMTLLAGLAIICLPRQFHVMVVENTHVADIRTASWLFPVYLLGINLFVLPVALTGLLLFPDGSVSADTFLVTIPMQQGWPWLALAAFIGGLSAATSMIIVGAVALSTMVSNDLVVPLLMYWKPALTRWQSNPKRLLLVVRQLAVVALLGLAYLCYLMIGTVFPLATIGMVSFAAVAQFGPALLVGLFNRRVTRAGAFAGICSGFMAWTWTVMLPSFAAAGLIPPDALDGKLFGLSWTGPADLGGLHDLDTLARGALVSLGLNAALLVAVSALTRQSELERLQARRFVNMRHDMHDGLRSQRSVTLADLYELATRYVGRARAEAVFRDLAVLRGSGADILEGALLARVNDEAVRATEWLLAGAIGSASARVVVAGLLTDRRLSRSDARSIIGDASRAILDQHLLLRTTLEHVGKGICAWDRDFRTLIWNRRFLELLDVPDGLMQVGMPLSELVAYLRSRGEYGRNGEMETLLARRSDPQRQIGSDLYHRVRPDGTVLEISTDPLPDGGFVAVYTDVTERHRAAEALREANEGLERRIAERTQALAAAKAEADRATQAKTRLLAAVSHDLLQPLHAARLFISAAMERTPDPLIPQADAALRSVEQLLGDLLDVTKLNTGVIRPMPTSVYIEDVLRPLAEETAVVASRQGLALRRVPCRACVRTDPMLLRRILQNFLANAVRYTQGGKILLGCRRAGDHLRIEVWDTGAGIPADKLQEIFQEFHQLDVAGGRKQAPDRGLGLGLSIVERFAALLGHRVTVRSAVGRGSCFAVDVPLAAAAAPARLSTGGAQQAGLAGTLVLCVENEAAVAAATRELLSGWMCEVVTAANAEEALAALGGRRPDVVLTDFHLDQGRSGLEVLACIRATFGQDVPAAAITADRSPAVREAVAAAGCRLAYKPIRPGALRALLGHLAAEGRRAKAV